MVLVKEGKWAQTNTEVSRRCQKEYELSFRSWGSLVNTARRSSSSCRQSGQICRAPPTGKPLVPGEKALPSIWNRALKRLLQVTQGPKIKATQALPALLAKGPAPCRHVMVPRALPGEGDGMGTCPAWREKGSPDFCICISSLLICLCQSSIITLAYNLGCFLSKHTKYMLLLRNWVLNLQFCTQFLSNNMYLVCLERKQPKL